MFDRRLISVLWIACLCLPSLATGTEEELLHQERIFLAERTAPAPLKQIASSEPFEALFTITLQVERLRANLRYWEGIDTSRLSPEDFQFVRARRQNLKRTLDRIALPALAKLQSAFSGSNKAPLQPMLQKAVTLTHQVEESQKKGSEAALRIRNPKGLWAGDSMIGPFLTADYVLGLRYFGKLTPEIARKAGNSLVSQQNEDGSVSNWKSGPQSVAFTYVTWMALDSIARVDPSFTAAAARARAFLNRQPPPPANIPTIEVFGGHFGYRPEPANANALLISTLRNAPGVGGVDRLALWARAILVPYSLISGLNSPEARQNQLSALQKGALNRTVDWLKESTEAGGAIFMGSTSALLGMIAYDKLTQQGHGNFRPQIQRGFDYLNTLVREDANQLHVTFPPYLIWDTPGMLLGVMGPHPSRATAERHGEVFDHLYGTQIREARGPWSHHANIPPGAWGSDDKNTLFPETEGTAQVLNLLRAGGRQDTQSVSQHIRGLQWLVGMQGSQGGWAAYDRPYWNKTPGPLTTRTIDDNSVGNFAATLSFPLSSNPLTNARGLANAAAAASALTKDNVLLFDYAAADLTGHSLEALTAFGYTPYDSPVKNAVAFLEKDRGAQFPFWYARFGIDYLYGTKAALAGMFGAGTDMHKPFIQRSVDWTLKHQNADGGWGVSYGSLTNPALAGSSRSSNVTQTAYALTILILTGRALSDEASRAVRYLIRHQGADGLWTDPNDSFYGVGFLTRYEYLAHYQVMNALNLYREAVPTAAGILAGQPPH